MTYHGQTLPRSSGAALLAVLIVAVVISLLLSAANMLMTNRLTLAQQSKQQLASAMLVHAKVNELTYILATQQRSVSGVSQLSKASSAGDSTEPRSFFTSFGDELRTDGFLYATDNGVSFSIQNVDGLIPVNTSSPIWLKKWLEGKGLNVAQQARFTDLIADYADGDDWRRPGGLESNGYNKSLSKPSNFLLQSCSELNSVAHLSILTTNLPQLIQLCSTRRTSSLNVNRIPLNLWRALWPSSADRLEKMRDQGKWFKSESDLLAIEPSFVSIVDESYGFGGGDAFKVVVKNENFNHVLVIETNTGNAPTFTLRLTTER